MKFLKTLNQTYAQLKIMLSIGLLLFIISCAKEETVQSSDKDGPTPKEIQNIYSHYIKGHYSEFVSHIASIQGKPRFYREQIINLYKQQAENQIEKFGKIDSIKVERINKSSDHKFASVNIILYYKNRTTEEIILQMVYTENRWKIK